MSSEQGESQSLPERPKEGEEGEKGPSKSALKKAAKEKEKVSIQCLNVEIAN